MSEERFLVTGATGCIGSWVIRNLVREGVPVRAMIRGSSMHRLRLIMRDEELGRVDFVRGDICDLNFLHASVRDFRPTHLIHLAALQLPFCREDPPRGATVNVAGTVNVFEAARRAGMPKVVYASSAAVYGPREFYGADMLGPGSALYPHSHYGVYKQANEGNARVYWLEEGLSSIGLRPHVVYGPGRDQGLTSAPTKAILAAVQGKPYHIPFGGRLTLQYADDVARLFIRAARRHFTGAGVYDIGGEPVSVDEVVKAVEEVVPSCRGTITFDDKALPFPEGMDNAPLRELLGLLEDRPLEQGIRESVEIFREALRKGMLPS